MTRSERLSGVLNSCDPAELAKALITLAEENHRTLRRLESAFGVALPVPEIVDSTRRAIAEATAFDKRDCNRNFEYDHEAYAAILSELKRLLGEDQLRVAMELALELMDKGSRQMEASDEGQMQDEIEECLRVVIAAVDQAACLRPDELKEWCAAMVRNDCLGFICAAELQALSEQFTAPTQFPYQS